MVNPGKNEDVGIYFKQSEARKGFQANRLAKDIEEDYHFIFSLTEENLYVYEDGVYKKDGARLVKEECNKRLQNYFSKSRVSDTLEAIKTRPGVAKKKKEFRPPEYKVNFQNGVYDLMNDEFIDHSPDFYFTSQIPHDYNQEANCENIKEFFKEITKTEEEAETLMELSGYAMLPNMPIEASFLLVGTGSNGKTMFLNTLKELVGEENAKDENLQHLENSRFGTSALYKKLMVVSDDLPAKQIESGDTLKGITGGGSVRAEIKGGKHFEFKNYATPIFACNEVPETEDQTPGFFRRWTLIDFPYEFTENPESRQEKQKESEFSLKQKLYDSEEQEGYASEAIKALSKVLQKQAFTAQKQPEETRKKWNSYASPIMEFIYDYVDQGVTYNEAQRKSKEINTSTSSQGQQSITNYDFDYIVKDELFALISAYCESRSARPPANKTELKKKLDDAGLYFSVARTTQTDFEDGQTNIYRGIRYSDKFQELLEECQSLRGLQGKLDISLARTHTHALARIENEISESPCKPCKDSENPRPEREIAKAFDELDAVGKREGVKRKYDDIEEISGLDPEDFEKIFDEMESQGLIHEQNPGEYVLDKKVSPENLVNV